MKVTAEDILEFFDEYHLHISDGVDSCSGEDRQEMKKAAEDLANRIEENACL